MGQLVGVVERASASPGVVRFETNRALSGQGHERYASVADAWGVRPTDELARRLFATGRVHTVHIYANIVTVELERGATSDGLSDIVRDLYQYWLPGVEPPTFEDLVPDTPAAAVAEGDSSDPWAAAAALVPPHLLERSRAARARLKG